MSFELVKPLRFPQQLAWIALPYNCYQLLGVNIFRVSRCGIKFSSTCWGKGKRGMSAAPSLRSSSRVSWEETLKTGDQNFTSNPCSCSSAAAETLLHCLPCHRARHSICSTVYWLSACRMNLEYFWSWDVCCHKSIGISGRRHNSVTFVWSEVC